MWAATISRKLLAALATTQHARAVVRSMGLVLFTTSITALVVAERSSKEPPFSEGLTPASYSTYSTAETKVRAPTVHKQRPRAPVPASNARYAIGDRLRLVFFERMGEDHEDAANVLSGFVERAELTGEYVVQQDGKLTLPLLGSVEVDTTQANVNLEKAFRQVFGSEAKVSITTAEREPVYIIGPTGRSATFKFTPGMSVLHAVAMLGATESDRTEFYLRAEQIRAVERVEQSRQKLKRLLPRMAVLRAEEGEPLEAPATLVELVGLTNAKALINDAHRARSFTLASREPQFELHRAAIAAARRETAGLKQKLTVLRRQIAAYEQRRTIITDLRQRGSGAPHAYFQSEAELAQAQQQEPEIAIALSAAQLRIDQAQQELVRLESNARAELEREIAALQAETEEQQVLITAAQRLITDAKMASLRLDPNLDSMSFGIVRRSKDGMHTISAVESTELMPGDLVRIASSSSSVGPTAN
jgi:protein involved in polysaccharide export with SLBB domain